MTTRVSHKVLSYLGFPLFIVGLGVAGWLFRRELFIIFASPQRLREWVNAWGYVAPVVFIGLQFLQVVLFVIPGEVAQAAGGYIFGMWAGVLYSVTGILIGSIFNFFLARLLGVPFVRAVFGAERLARFDNVLNSQRATVAFFLLFLIPGIPKDALCYVAGLSTIRFSLFMMVSTVGRLPGIIGSSALGGAAANRMWLTVATIGVAALVLFAIGLLYRERLHLVVERLLTRREPQSTGGAPGGDAPDRKPDARAAATDRKSPRGGEERSSRSPDESADEFH